MLRPSSGELYSGRRRTDENISRFAFAEPRERVGDRARVSRERDAIGLTVNGQHPIRIELWSLSLTKTACLLACQPLYRYRGMGNCRNLRQLTASDAESNASNIHGG